jgi:hypothetical protein
MNSGSTSDKLPLELICEHAQTGATGLLEITDDRKKRGFYFRDGVLYLTSSNLKSESIEGLKTRIPNATEGKLLKLQGELRVINASAIHGGQWSFTEGLTTDGDSPVDVIATVWKALQKKGDLEKLRQRIVEIGEGFPVLTNESKQMLKSINLPQEIGEFLSNIDGERSADELLSFSPIDPEDAVTAIYFALTVGIISIEEDTSHHAEISVTDGKTKTVDQDLIDQTISKPARQPRAQDDKKKDSPLDIANMIANQIGTEVAAPASR